MVFVGILPGILGAGSSPSVCDACGVRGLSRNALSSNTILGVTSAAISGVPVTGVLRYRVASWLACACVLHRFMTGASGQTQYGCSCPPPGGNLKLFRGNPSADAL